MLALFSILTLPPLRSSLIVVWEVNLSAKNATTVLHEFCQLYFHASPSFSFSDTSQSFSLPLSLSLSLCVNEFICGALIEGPPYCCEVKVGGVNYGSGKAVNKRVAKVTAGEWVCLQCSSINPKR